MNTRTIDFYNRYGRETWKDVKTGDERPPNARFRLSLCLEVLNELINLCEKKELTKDEVDQIAVMLRASAS